MVGYLVYTLRLCPIRLACCQETELSLYDGEVRIMGFLGKYTKTFCYWGLLHFTINWAMASLILDTLSRVRHSRATARLMRRASSNL